LVLFFRFVNQIRDHGVVISVQACTVSDDNTNDETDDEDNTDDDNSDDSDNDDSSDDDSSDDSDNDDGSDDGSGDGSDGDGTDDGDGSGDGTDGDSDGDDNGDSDGDGSDDGDDSDGGDSGDDSDDDGSDNDSDDDSGNDGDDDSDGNGDNPDDDGACTDCFTSTIIEASVEGNDYSYTFEVSVDGDCRYDLSHYTIALPTCVTLTDYSNSRGWKMEYVSPDPTTGITGIKVDDVSAFKQNGDSFTVSVAFTTDNCDVDCWSPVVAYKAGQCVTEQTVNEVCATGAVATTSALQVYPNPTSGSININTEVLKSGVEYTVKLFDTNGTFIATLAQGKAESLTAQYELPVQNGNTGYYYVVLTSTEGDKITERILINK
jgi:hypothetical protein